MRTPLQPMSVVSPRTLPEALARLRDDPGLLPLAGCTDIYVLVNAGTPPASRFLNLWPLDELRGITTLADGGLRVGALTTYRALIDSPAIRAVAPMLAEAADVVGGEQIHNRGTLGGNVANASPAGDTLPVLSALEATVVLVSAVGERRVPFTDFYTGYRRTIRRPDELIGAFELPPADGRQWFRKVGTRAAQAISKVVMAAVRPDDAGAPPRIALGSVAPTVVRVPDTERLLATGASMDEVRRILAQEISPIDDIRSTAAYRLRVAGNLVARFWADTATPSI